MGSKLNEVLDDITVERTRQREKFGDEHDDRHSDGTLSLAGALAAAPPIYVLRDQMEPADGRILFYRPEPWDGFYPQLRKWQRGNQRKRLVIAAALLVAEIERLDRMQRPDGAGGE